VNAKVSLILLIAFKRAMMLFIKDGVDTAIQELRAEDVTEAGIAPQRHLSRASDRRRM
jgi:hypothetical protein